MLLYRSASSGVLIVASRSKYVLVVSFMRIGGCHAAIFATAPAKCAIAFDRRGRDPCPAGPVATSFTA